MIEVIVEKDTNAGEWNNNVKSIPQGNFYQTTFFAEAMKNLRRHEPIFVKAVEGRTLLGLLLLHKAGLWEQAFERKPLEEPIIKIIRKIIPFFYWSNGPIVFEKLREKEILIKILNKVDEIAKSEHICLTEATPPIHFNAFTPAYSDAFCENNFSTKPFATFVIDLTQPQEILWDKLDKAAKKAVMACQSAGVEWSIAKNEKEVEAYLALLCEFRKKAGLFSPPFYPSADLWKSQHGKTLDIFLAKHKEELISGIGVVYFNSIVTEVAAARSFDTELYAQDFLKWAIITWAKNTGAKIYDLAGVNPNPVTPKEKGGYQFKAKWGGQLLKYDIYSKTYFQKRMKLISGLKKTIKKALGHA